MRGPIAALTLLAACMETPATPPPPSPLIDSRWIMADAGADAPTIEFSENRAGGYAGCNRWFAQVSSNDLALSFTGVGATRRMCSAEVMAVEGAFFATLNSTKTARLDSDALVLQDIAGADLARFTRVR